MTLDNILKEARKEFFVFPKRRMYKNKLTKPVIKLMDFNKELLIKINNNCDNLFNDAIICPTHASAMISIKGAKGYHFFINAGMMYYDKTVGGWTMFTTKSSAFECDPLSYAELVSRILEDSNVSNEVKEKLIFNLDFFSV